MRLPGGHVTFGAGRQATTRTMPMLTDWIKRHGDALAKPKER
jgi:hypothetical protein